MISNKTTSSKKVLTRDLVSQKVFDDMVRIGNREQLLSTDQRIEANLMLVQLLFAYLYDLRTMEWENTCETGWTITKLSPFLSGFVYHSSSFDCMVNLYRRVMIYPVYRHYKLAKKVHEDLVSILSHKLICTKLVSEVKHIFEKSDCRHLLNVLYIDDMMVYIQGLEKEELSVLQDEVKQAKVEKHDLKLMLDEFESEGMQLDAD